MKNKRNRGTGTIELSNEVLDVLGKMQCVGNEAVIPEFAGQLDRKLYVAVDQALQAIGGKWSRGARAHVFHDGVDATSLVDAVVLSGSCVDPRSGDFFETPPGIARDLVERAKIRSDSVVLEPSAGLGAIAREIAKAEPARLILNEKDPSRAEKMRAVGLDVFVGDFLTSCYQGVDRIVMNPPFAMQQDVEHAHRALDVLVPGGILVSVMSAGARFRTTRRAIGLRERVADMGGTFEDLPDGSFAESGTNVRTCVLTVAVSGIDGGSTRRGGTDVRG